MRFKKIYVEITNACNLKCDFCIKNDRDIKYITLDNFDKLLDKIDKYTNYIYMHVLGEPLMHPDINELINLAKEKNKNVNITTNGYLIDRIENNDNIRQVNISLHSYDKRYGINLNDYLDKVFNISDKLIKKGTYVSLRIWVKSKYTKDIFKYINDRYNKNISLDSFKNNYTIKDNLFLSQNDEFIWPDLNNSYYSETGSCYGLIDHIGILVDGTVVPCCLDSKGIINLGNIYKDSLDDILNSKQVNEMINGFKNNKKICELCKHCKYL